MAIAAATEAGLDGDATLRVMLLIDEIRGRLAEVFPLRKYAIDHVHHGTVASAAAFTAALGGDAARIGVVQRQWRKLEKIRHSQAFLDAAKQARLDAARAIELAGRPEKIPPAGMLELVRADAKSQGPRLFAQHCASCHAHVDPRSPGAEAILAKASAANLFEFGRASWMRGLLDPAQVAGPAYFGNTAHKEGDMVSFVQGDLADADQWKKDDIEAVIVAMASEAGLADPGVQPAILITDCP